MKSKTAITISAVSAVATILATRTMTKQIVVAQPSQDEPQRNCNHGNAYACGALDGDQVTMLFFHKIIEH